MVPFDEFMNQSIAASRQPKPTKIPAPVLDSLKSAGILPATWPESPSPGRSRIQPVDENRMKCTAYRLAIPLPAVLRSGCRYRTPGTLS